MGWLCVLRVGSMAFLHLLLKSCFIPLPPPYLGTLVTFGVSTRLSVFYSFLEVPFLAHFRPFLHRLGI
jgi:hypothetical protein